MKNLINLVFVFSLLFGQHALAITDAEKNLLTQFVSDVLEAGKSRDLESVARFLDTDFIGISESLEEPDLTMNRDEYLEYIAEWLIEAQFYDYDLETREVFRLPDGQGYGVESRVTERYIVDGLYQREAFTQIWSIRNTPDGFKVYKVILQD
ncbi:MAG: hypothetical protein JJ936_14425 [Psychroserpens sp.]|nr:hypothetical protein [Psychroserpens sp.]